MFKLRNEPAHTFKFQVDPPITYSSCAQSIVLEDSEVSAGSSVDVTGWGRTIVSQYITFCVEQQLIFCQNLKK